MSELSQVMATLIKSGKGDTILEVMLDLGVAPCVARELANEPKRRKAMAERRDRRAMRKLMSKATRKNVGHGYRRIIYTQGPRPDVPFERQFHSTKGWREYRAVVR